MSRSIDNALTRRICAALTAALLVSGLAACDLPNYEGPQLQDPPQGYLLRSDGQAGGGMFSHLPEVHHDTWVQSQAPFSTIQIHGYAGTLTLEDVIAAQDSVRAHASDPDMAFGAVEPLMIDGREAWAWEERIDSPARGIPWVAYRAMIPYDTITYTVEISTEDPALKSGAPESLRAIVSTFAVGETVYNWPLIAIGAGLLFFAMHMLRQSSRSKAERLQSINLVKVQKPGDDEETLPLHPEPSSATAPAATEPPTHAPDERPPPPGWGGPTSAE